MPESWGSPPLATLQESQPGYTHATGAPTAHIGKVRRLVAAACAGFVFRPVLHAVRHSQSCIKRKSSLPRQVSDDFGDVPDQTEGGLRGVSPKVRHALQS